MQSREAREEAIEFVRELEQAPIERKAIENPVGVLSTVWREPDQYIQPHEFNDDASKITCLWLDNLEPLKATGFFPPRLVWNGKRHVFRWGNQTDSGQNKVPPSDDRWMIRSTFYPGWSAAMADQWGCLLDQAA